MGWGKNNTEGPQQIGNNSLRKKKNWEKNKMLGRYNKVCINNTRKEQYMGKINTVGEW